MVTYMLSWVNSFCSCRIKLESSSTDSVTVSVHGSWWLHDRADVVRRSAWKPLPRLATRECDEGPAQSFELWDFISDKTSWKFAASEWLRPVDYNAIDVVCPRYGFMPCLTQNRYFFHRCSSEPIRWTVLRFNTTANNIVALIYTLLTAAQSIDNSSGELNWSKLKEVHITNLT